MRKRLLQLIVVVAVSSVLIFAPSVVLADTSADVVVTAVGFIVEAPGGFTVYYISDYEVGLSWTKPEGADNTMIRAAYGRMPEDREDGYLVYYGDLEYTSDTAVALDDIAVPVYYRAWSQNEGGVWENEGSTGFIEGWGMLMIAFVLLCLGLTIGGYTLHRGSLAFAGMAAWMAMGAYCYITADGEWGIYMGLFWVCIAMIFTSGLEGALLSRGTEQAEDEIDRRNAMEQALDEMDENIESRRSRRRGGG